MTKVATFLWFNNQAQEAAKFYTSLFPNSSVQKTVTIPGAGPDGNETVQLVEFEVEGQRFIAFNGGPYHTFNEAISISINVETQEEVDHLWKNLIADGGQEVVCGWLKDKYGLSWQIVPSILPQLLSKGDKARSEAMMQAMHTMKKLDIAQLQRAYESVK